MPNTLFGRLLVTSLLLLSLFFGFLGFVINQLFQENIVSGKQQQLRLQNSVLLSAAQFSDNDSIELPDELRESRFDDYESGLYGFISDDQGKILWSSYSAHSLSIPTTLLSSKNRQPGNGEFIQHDRYYIYHYNVLWEFIEDQPQLLTFSVLEDSTPTHVKFSLFEKRLSLWLSGIGMMLITMMLLTLRWGTAPLRQLANKLKQVESGETQRLEGKYPVELRGITNNLNELLVNEKRQRERYHSTLSDLAHSLKTPLAVIQAELESGTTELELIAEQSQRMDEIIKHQLQRAVVSGPHKLSESVNVRSCVERISNALSKVYANKGISFELDIDINTSFKGDQRDLIEVLGNLLDNACKACTNTVKIETTATDNQLVIGVHDDGKGIPEEQRQQLIKRGLRADTRHGGQGIGLDVARDIVESYKGKLTITDSHLGGALFEITIPA